jgi:sugar phosphate isomerase/epimerase
MQSAPGVLLAFPPGLLNRMERDILRPMNRSCDLSRRQFIGATALGLAGITGVAQDLSLITSAPAGYQVGCYTRCFDQYDFRTALDGIAEAGYRYAGIMTAKGKSWVVVTPKTDPDEAAGIGRDVRERGLKTLSVYGDFAVAEGIEKGAQDLRRLIDNCGACGSPNLLIGGTTDEKVFDNYYKAVAEACPYAAEKGVTITVKPHGGQNATGPQCRRIIERVNKPNFRLWYDPGNVFYYSNGGLDPVLDSEQVDGIVSGMCVKDWMPPKEVLLTPGTGKVDFPAVFANLRKGGFTRGPLVVECVKRGEFAEVVAEAKKARLFVESLIRSF